MKRLNKWCAKNGVSRAQAYRLLASGKLKAKKLGRNTYIEDAEDERFVRSLPDYVSQSAA